MKSNEHIPPVEKISEHDLVGRAEEIAEEEDVGLKALAVFYKISKGLGKGFMISAASTEVVNFLIRQGNILDVPREQLLANTGMHLTVAASLLLGAGLIVASEYLRPVFDELYEGE